MSKDYFSELKGECRNGISVHCSGRPTYRRIAEPGASAAAAGSIVLRALGDPRLEEEEFVRRDHAQTSSAPWHRLAAASGIWPGLQPQHAGGRVAGNYPNAVGYRHPAGGRGWLIHQICVRGAGAEIESSQHHGGIVTIDAPIVENGLDVARETDAGVFRAIFIAAGLALGVAQILLPAGLGLIAVDLLGAQALALGSDPWR